MNEQSPKTAWQPIETAPHEVPVLVEYHQWNDRSQPLAQQVAWFYGGQWRPYPNTEHTAYADRWMPLHPSAGAADQGRSLALGQDQPNKEAVERDAARYRWLRDHKCCELTLSRDGDHACNYMTSSAWIDDHPDDFADDPQDEVQRMRDTNTIWRLQIYPNTPVGFNFWNGATLDAAIDRAMSTSHPTGSAE